MRILISCLLFMIATFGYAEGYKEFYGIKIGTPISEIENFEILKRSTIKDLDRPFDLIKGKILDEEKNFYLAVIDGNIEGIEFIQYFNEPMDVNAKLAEMEKNGVRE